MLPIFGGHKEKTCPSRPTFCGPWLFLVLCIRLSWSIVASTSRLISQIQLGQGYIQNVSKCQVQYMKFRNVGKITHNDTCTYKLYSRNNYMVWPTQKVEAICDISVLVEHLKCTPTKNLFESWVIGSCSIYPPGTFAPRDGCELSQLGSSDPKACRPRESKPGRLRTFTGTWWNMVKRTESETQIILWYEEVHKDQDLDTYLRQWKKNIVFIGQGFIIFLQYSSWGPSHPPVPWKWPSLPSPVRHVCNGVGLSHLSDYDIQQSAQTISK